MTYTVRCAMESIRVSARHPTKFFQEVHDRFDGLPHDVILPVDTQKAIISLLSKVRLPTVQRYRNPSFNENYLSSSWNAQEGRFETPRGGFGMPQSVDGSFYASHTDADFQAALPQVDQTAYSKSRPRRVRNRELAREPVSPPPAPITTHMAVPKVMITDTDVVEHVISTKLTPATMHLVPSESKTEDLQLCPAAAFRASAGDDQDDIMKTSGENGDAVLDKIAAANTQSVAKLSDSDPKIGHEDTTISDTKNLGDGTASDIYSTQNFSQDTTATSEDTAYASNQIAHSTADMPDPAKNVHRSTDFSQGVDSTYGTQPALDTPDVSESKLSELDGHKLIPATLLRKKLVPEKSAAVRRSSRISELRNESLSRSLSPSSRSNPASTSRKRNRKSDAGVQEPGRKQKRLKAVLP